MESVRRIAVFRALYLGDLLCAVPFFRALRRAWPAAEVTLIGLPWARAFVRRCSYLDRFVTFPGFPGLWPRPVRPDRVLAGLRALQARRFDLVVNLHGGGLVSTIFCVLLGGRRTVGLYQRPEAPDLYGLDLAVPYHTDRHEVQRLLAVATAMGAPRPATIWSSPSSRSTACGSAADCVAGDCSLSRSSSCTPGRARPAVAGPPTASLRWARPWRPGGTGLS